jgi:hypothetical protein
MKSNKISPSLFNIYAHVIEMPRNFTDFPHVTHTYLLQMLF